jgi:hypothetical protein
MKKGLKVSGSVLVGVLALTLFTLRLTGLEPGYTDPPTREELALRGRPTTPGLWLKGEVVTTPVTNWDFVRKVRDPIRGNLIMIETRTWYGIPHSVTIGIVGRGDNLYVHAHSDQTRVATTPFPYDKVWTANVARDPRVRMKIDGKIYEMTLALIADRAEVAAIMGRDPVTREKGPDGQETVKEVMHYWRVFQRNIPEHGSGAKAAVTSAPISPESPERRPPTEP